MRRLRDRNEVPVKRDRAGELDQSETSAVSAASDQQMVNAVKPHDTPAIASYHTQFKKR